VGAGEVVEIFGEAPPSRFARLTIDFSFHLKSELRPNDFLVADLEELGVSTSGDGMEAYPESAESSEVSLPPLNRD